MATSDDVRINIIADTKNAVKNMAMFAAGIGAAILVARKLIKVGADMVNAYAEQEQAEARLAAAIRSTGQEATINQKSLQNLASSLQKVTIYGDEATISAMAMLQQLSNLDQKGLEAVTPAMLDFASAMNVDINVAAQLIGKTLGSTTNALARYGVVVDATAEPSEKLAEITQALNDKFGGTAEAIGATTLGAMEQYKNAMGDLKEQGGELVAEFLNPAISLLTEFATAAGEAITEAANLKEAREALESGEFTLGDEIAIQEELVNKLSEAYRDAQQEAVEYEKTLSLGIGGASYDALQDLIDAEMEAKEVYEGAKDGLKGLTDQLEMETKGVDGLTAAERENLVHSENLTAELERQKTAYENSTIAIIDAKREQLAYFKTFIQGPDAIEAVEGLATEIDGLVNSSYSLADADTSLMGLLPAVNTEMSILGFASTQTAAMIDGLADSTIYLDEEAIQPAIESINGYKNALEELAEEMAIVRVESGEMEEHLRLKAELAEKVTTALETMGKDGLGALGVMFVDAAKGGEQFKEAMKDAAATTIRALGDYAFAQAGISLAAGDLLHAGLYGAGGAAAYAFAGGIAALGEGGIVNSPTLALIGEAGPEAVVPLNKSGGSGVHIVNHVYGNILTERQLTDSILRRAANSMRSY